MKNKNKNVVEYKTNEPTYTSFDVIKDKIELVKNDLLKRFPNCSHSITVLLWDDGDCRIECRYGDGKKIYISDYYHEKMTYSKYIVNGRIMLKDKFGKSHLLYVTDKKPIDFDYEKLVN